MVGHSYAGAVSVIAQHEPARPRLAEPKLARNRIVDGLVVACALCGAVLALAEGRAYSPAMAEPIWLFCAGVGLIACVALTVRRRWPVWVAALVTLAGAVSTVTVLAVPIALFTVAVHRETRVALWTAAAGLATLAPHALLYPQWSDPPWAQVEWGVVITIATLGWGLLVRSRRQLVTSLREQVAHADSARALREERARRVERVRIAREMHDCVANRVSLISLQAGALESTVDPAATQLAEYATSIRVNAHTAMRELRELIGVLRDPDGADNSHTPPDLAAVSALVDETAASGTPVEFDMAITPDSSPPPATVRTLHRMVHEGLINARKHAPGATVRLRVFGDATNGLSARMTNPLTRPATAETTSGMGLGLAGLAERAGLDGGWLRHRLTSNEFELWMWVPWR